MALFRGKRIKKDYNLSYKCAIDAPLYISQGNYNNYAVASVKSYSLVAGGVESTYTSSYSDSVYSDKCFVYDKFLTKSIITSLAVGRTTIAGLGIENYALFAGGSFRRSPYNTDNVDVYNFSLTKCNNLTLSSARGIMFSATINGYALFAGGCSYLLPSPYNTNSVDVYDSSLTHSLISLSTASGSNGYIMSGLSSKSYAIIPIIDSNSRRCSIVNAFDKYLTRTIPANLGIQASQCATLSINGYSLFVAGMRHNGNTGSNSNYTDIYDDSLVHTATTFLSSPSQAQGITLKDLFGVVVRLNDPGKNNNLGIFNPQLVQSRFSEIPYNDTDMVIGDGNSFGINNGRVVLNGDDKALISTFAGTNYTTVKDYKTIVLQV